MCVRYVVRPLSATLSLSRFALVLFTSEQDDSIHLNIGIIIIINITLLYNGISDER